MSKPWDRERENVRREETRLSSACREVAETSVSPILPEESLRDFGFGTPK